MDDSDTNCYKWWDNVDRKENFHDILGRVSQGGDFASDEERIVEAMHIISYLFEVVDSKGTDGEDDWDGIRAIKKILQHSTAWKTWWEKNSKKRRRVEEEENS